MNKRLIFYIFAFLLTVAICSIRIKSCEQNTVVKNEVKQAEKIAAQDEKVLEKKQVDYSKFVDSITRENKKLQNRIEELKAATKTFDKKVDYYKNLLSNNRPTYKRVIIEDTSTKEERQQAVNDLLATVDTLQISNEKRKNECDSIIGYNEALIFNKNTQINKQDSTLAAFRTAFLSSKTFADLKIKQQKNRIVKKTIENWLWRGLAATAAYLVFKNNIK